MAQVRWSPTAGNDLQDIEDFIARDSIPFKILPFAPKGERGQQLLSAASMSALAKTRLV